MNVWNRVIFDALEKRERQHGSVPVADLFPAARGQRLSGRRQVYARMTTQRRWREWLTHHLLDRWLTNGRYYQLHLVLGDHKNPEYRIADDVRLATESPVDFATGVTTAVLSAATFITVLWTIGGSLRSPRRHRDHHPRLSRGRRRDLCAAGQRIDGLHRPPLRYRLREQESGRSRISATCLPA